MWLKLTVFQVEAFGGHSRPKPHCVDNVVPVARNGRVIWHSEDRDCIDPSLLAVGVGLDIAVEINFERVLRPRLFPRVAVYQPIIWYFHLRNKGKSLLSILKIYGSNDESTSLTCTMYMTLKVY